MNKPKLVATGLYGLVTLITAGIGLRFLLATEYFDYHTQASGINWGEVHPGLQLLALAGFKLIAAGFLAVTLSLTLLIIFPYYKQGQRWSTFAIASIGILFWSIILVTTLMVSSATGAATPWGGSLFCVLVLAIAFILSLFDHNLRDSP